MILVKKIVPFNNVLTFNTDVCEITAISLEHEIKKLKKQEESFALLQIICTFAQDET